MSKQVLSLDFLISYVLEIWEHDLISLGGPGGVLFIPGS